MSEHTGFAVACKADNKFDGDKCTGMGVFTNEATAESRKLLKSRSFYVLPTGKVAHSVNTDTVKYLCKGLLSKPQPINTPEK